MAKPSVIYLGKIKKWDDEAIKQLNSGPEAAVAEHRRGPPRRWFWYLLRFHQLPVQSE